MTPIAGDKNGFTFIEVMVAMVIITVGILSLNAMQVSYIRGNATAGHVTMATTWNSDLLETMVAMPYDDLDRKDDADPMEDRDGDGTGKDANGDGVDDSGNDFGLNDIDLNADHNSIEHPDILDPALVELYTVYWNVAVDQPIPNAKTIRALVVRNSDNVVLAIFETYKANL
ncbi:MAG: prepilin-type N-terminal cleavage/methylation domain-containing protein [Desulfobulbaceae bacterium]|nr:prepilin-type N-terminal cleavage/methylation domain-containing protein [Desulfobulbaceae bacterium]